MSTYYLSFYCKRFVNDKPYGKFHNMEIIDTGNGWDKVVITIPDGQYAELINDISKLAKIVNEVRPESSTVMYPQLQHGKSANPYVPIKHKKKMVNKPYYRKERF